MTFSPKPISNRAELEELIQVTRENFNLLAISQKNFEDKVNAFISNSTGTIKDHGNLDGLLDDDHTQYLLLAGRSGQTISDTVTVTGDVTLTTGDADLTSGVYKVGGTQVVGAQNTGWTDQTATASKADLGASPTVGALSSFCRALYDAVKTHGLIGN